MWRRVLALPGGASGVGGRIVEALAKASERERLETEKATQEAAFSVEAFGGAGGEPLTSVLRTAHSELGSNKPEADFPVQNQQLAAANEGGNLPLDQAIEQATHQVDEQRAAEILVEVANHIF